MWSHIRQSQATAGTRLPPMKRLTEISCHARGARRLVPGVRTVVDIGGQDSKFISIDEHEEVSDFVMNDRCAAGTGRFLEVISGMLGVGVDRLGELALGATAARRDWGDVRGICREQSGKPRGRRARRGRYRGGNSGGYGNADTKRDGAHSGAGACGADWRGSA